MVRVINPVTIDVAILAGGLGTRLRGAVPGTPKVLAPLCGRPFLDWLLEWLKGQGVTRVVLGLGYRADAVLRHLSDGDHEGLEIVPMIEPKPLGTAGAIAFLRPQLKTEPVMIVNGDTIVDADLGAFFASHQSRNSKASILCVKVEDAGRYGRVDIDTDDTIAGFREKDRSGGPSWISGGVYLFGREMLDRITQIALGSLERDVLAISSPRSIHAFRCEGKFLDIGTPETLAIADQFVSCWNPEMDVK